MGLRLIAREGVARDSDPCLPLTVGIIIINHDNYCLFSAYAPRQWADCITCIVSFYFANIWNTVFL